MHKYTKIIFFKIKLVIHMKGCNQADINITIRALKNKHFTEYLFYVHNFMYHNLTYIE